MSYANASDLAALNKARVIGAPGQPTVTDAQTYLSMSAAEIDAILVNKGYTVPVGSQYTSAWNLLNAINAQGALVKMEEAAQSSRILDSATKAYQASLEMLKTAAQVMDAPKDVQRADPRGPFFTFTPPEGTFDPQLASINGTSGDGISGGGCNNRTLPLFSRGMRFSPIP